MQPYGQPLDDTIGSFLSMYWSSSNNWNAGNGSLFRSWISGLSSFSMIWVLSLHITPLRSFRLLFSHISTNVSSASPLTAKSALHCSRIFVFVVET